MAAKHWDILTDVAARSQRYLNAIGERRVSPSAEAVAALSAFDTPVPNEPTPTETILESLDQFAAPATVAINGPRYFGFVNGGALPGVLAVNWLTTSWEQHGAFQVSGPATTYLERIALRWTIDLLGLPTESAGAFATGTTTADMIALAAARQSVLARAGWDADADGLFGAPPITVIVSDETHSTLFKALGVVGMGRNRVVKVPVDSQGRMLANKMPRITGPTIVIAQAGNVNSGAFDPCDEIAEHVRSFDAPSWIHVDGAFGIWVRVAPQRAHLARGLELADSWATDAHKWLNTPYDCGIVIVKDAAALRGAMRLSAAYLPTDTANAADYTLEGSRRPRGVDVWGVLKVLGRSGLADMVERHCQLAKRFADAFIAAGYEVLNDVVINQVLVSFGDAEKTRRVIAGVQEDGTCWCGGTVWQGKTAMRVSVICWATTEADVDQSVAAILRIAERS